MFVEDPKALCLLRQMIARLHVSLGLREDLSQEALLHLWADERRHPGHERSWYLRGCWLHLMNVLRAGRSVDCPKRHAKRVRYNEEQMFEESSACGSAVSDDVLDEVSAHDVVAELSLRLDARELETLQLLADGLTGREVARRIHVSHTAVARRRHHIARVALCLGLQPPAPMRLRNPL